MIYCDHPAMVLLTYTPRIGTNLGEYEDWLRRVDNPFFNNVPGIGHYTNWKVVQPEVDAVFTYFDFLSLSNVEDFERIWSSSAVMDFTAHWRSLWGQSPDGADLALNAHIYIFQRQGGGLQVAGQQVWIEASRELNDVWLAEESWKLVRSVRGDPRFHYLRISFTGDWEQKTNVIQGKIIAAPS